MSAETATNYRQAKKIARDAGMSVSRDGLAFTVCGGQLVTGENAPEHIKRLNGCCVWEAAASITKAEHAA